MSRCGPYLDPQGVDLGVGRAVHGPVHVILEDVEQRAVVELVGPLEGQHGLAEGAGAVVPQLRGRETVSLGPATLHPTAPALPQEP